MQKKKVTKFEIVDSVYEKLDCEKKTVQRVVDAFLEELKNSLKDASTIELRGFGTFEIRTRKGRSVARNPKNGELVSVPPHNVVAFRAGRELKSCVWNLSTDGE